MAAHESTLNIARGHTSAYRELKWSSFDSGANNCYFDVSNKDASNMIILLAGHSTLPNRLWIGTSDSRSSHTSKSYPFRTQNTRRMLIKTTVVNDAHARSKFKSTKGSSAGSPVGDSEVWAIFAFGPFETERFKDSNGRINICRGITTVGGASHSSDEQHVCAILLP
jgi:hypothetical protein